MTSAQREEHPGHHWQEPDRVAEYVQRMDRQQEERQVLFEFVTRLIPFPADAAIRVLDVGSGYGVVATAVLDAFPRATAIGLDISDAMMEVGRERMARFGDRFAYVVGDFGAGALPSSATQCGPFNVVVSARAIHHLPPEEMGRLYAAIYANLEPGGCFFNIDTASAPNDFLRQVYRNARHSERSPEEPTPAAQGGQAPHTANLYHHRDATLQRHLAWLQEAGFETVDCVWKRMEQAIVGGYKQ